MSGTDVPYQLRPNKFVERQLFLECLERLAFAKEISNYVYVSMGGRFLQDFQMMHSRFNLKDLVSIESDDITYDRQVFNRPHSFILCQNQTSEEFITAFDSFADKYKKKNFAIWMDYASAKKRKSQLEELQELTSKLAAFDIVKVTLNANKSTLGSQKNGEGQSELQVRRLGNLKSKLGDTFPDEPIASSEITDVGFARILALSVKKSALKGLKGSPELSVVPIAQYRYQDGPHQMFTSTMVLWDQRKVESLKKKTGLNNWEYTAASWEDVRQIAIPDLSWKERIALNELIFSEPIEQVHAKLSFKLSKENSRSLAALRQYVEHYRRIPGFVRAEI